MQITRKLYIKYTFLVTMFKINILNLLHYPIGHFIAMLYLTKNELWWIKTMGDGR